MTYSPIIGMNTRMLPVISPGRAIGRVTWRKVAQRPAPAGRAAFAEAEDEDDRERDDEQDQVPGGRRQDEARRQPAAAGPAHTRRPRGGRRDRGHVDALVGLAADARDELLPDLDAQRIGRDVVRALEIAER